jgi:hypothetical protein
MLRRRPSPALVIACIALFLSLGGVSYGLATGSIDSRELKNNSIASGDVRNNTLRTFDIRNNEVRGFDIRNSTVQGRDVAFDTLTGADVEEASLGKVPSATAADSAATAATVGGLRVEKFFAKPPPSTPATAILRTGNLVVEGGCTAAGNAVLQLDQVAGTPATNVAVSRTGSADVADFEASPSLGADFDLVGAAPSAAGTATLSTTGGTVVTIVYAAQTSAAFPGENVCSLRGTVTTG